MPGTDPQNDVRRPGRIRLFGFHSGNGQVPQRFSSSYAVYHETRKLPSPSLPYKTPRFRYGREVDCEVRGEVIIAGISDPPIPWPLARLLGRSSRGLVIYGGLLKALKREAALAICEAWGVTPQTVTYWRKQLGIGPNTDGSRELRREHGKRNWPKVGPKFLAKAHDPERAAKKAAAKLGKPRPPEVIEAMRQANLGRKLSAAHRRRLREAHQRGKGKA